MEFVQEIKGYCDKEEEQVMVEERIYKKLPFFPSSSSSSSSKYKDPKAYDKYQRLWFESEEEAAAAAAAAARSYPITNSNTKQLELSDLSLRHNDEFSDGAARSNGSGGGGDNNSSTTRLNTEREHMFDKVVTPSDVGKLNRLVIPKQHAEKYFPLDSSSNEKGLLLNFEDRNGKPWRFRYSYWNSSQSYVMTKGWSRFVKEKKLDAGDIVSFERGVGESAKDRLYIDWRRRRPAADAPHPTSLVVPFSPSPVRWGRLNSLPQSMSINPLPPRDYYNNHHPHPYYHHQHLYHQYQQEERTNYGNSTPPPHDYSMVNSSPGSHYNYLRSTLASHQIGTVQQQQQQQHGGYGYGHGHGDVVPMVIESVPVVHGKTAAAKRLRLFGVNMECPIADDDPDECDILSSTTIPAHVTMASLSSHHHHILSSSSHSPTPQLKLYNAAPLPLPPHSAEFAKKGKGSLSFDLDL